MFIVVIDHDISCVVVVHVKVKMWCTRHLRRLRNQRYVKGHRNLEVS